MKAKNGNIFLALDAAKLSLPGVVMVPIPFLFLVSIFYLLTWLAVLLHWYN